MGAELKLSMCDDITVEKVPVLAGEINAVTWEPDQWLYLFKGLDKKTNQFASVVASKEAVDKDAEFEQMVLARVYFKLRQARENQNEKKTDL